MNFFKISNFVILARNNHKETKQQGNRNDVVSMLPSGRSNTHTFAPENTLQFVQSDQIMYFHMASLWPPIGLKILLQSCHFQILVLFFVCFQNDIYDKTKKNRDRSFAGLKKFPKRNIPRLAFLIIFRFLAWVRNFLL